MENGIFISLLNPAIALVLASAFLLLWLYQRHHLHVAAMAAAYAVSAGGFLLQTFTLPIGFVASKLLSNFLFILAGATLAAAVIGRYGRPVPFAALALLGAGGFAAFSWFIFYDDDLTWRILSTNFALGGICLVAAAELRRVPERRPVDTIVLVLALLAGLNFFVRPVVIVAMSGPYESYEGFYSSLYWTTAVLSHAILSLLLALSLLTAAALDVLKQLRTESRHDALSGLLNRRGFEAAASEALRRSIGQRVPAALVLADLDHFKSVNDNFGHDAGDRVIAAFARKIRAAARSGEIAGRIGGEEFAVFLTAADLAAARLFAEGIRASFSQSELPDVPSAVRVTASFGVATVSGDEGLAALFRRADEALYHAKKSGRDRVRLSYQRPEAPIDSALIL